MALFYGTKLGLLIPAVLITLLGLVQLSSLSQYYYQNQLIFFCVGLILYFISFYFAKDITKSFVPQLYLICMILLPLTIIIGIESKGAVRWLSLGFFRFQPSEVAKVILVLFLARYLSQISKVSVVAFLKVLILCGSVFTLVLLQPDLGTAIVIGIATVAMLLSKGVSLQHVLVMCICVGFLSPIAWGSLKDYQKERVYVFLNPYLDPLGSGYNVLQSQIATGSGQVFGKGYGKGTQSRLKFLPEFHTDFIFASFAEEWGFLGVSVLLLLYFVLFFNILNFTYQATDPFTFFTCIGIYSILLAQTLINIFMNIGLAPVTGIPLPFMSYGGSSLLVSYISLGLLNSLLRK